MAKVRDGFGTRTGSGLSLGSRSESLVKTKVKV